MADCLEQYGNNEDFGKRIIGSAMLCAALFGTHGRDAAEYAAAECANRFVLSGTGIGEIRREGLVQIGVGGGCKGEGHWICGAVSEAVEGRFEQGDSHGVGRPVVGSVCGGGCDRGESVGGCHGVLRGLGDGCDKRESSEGQGGGRVGKSNAGVVHASADVKSEVSERTLANRQKRHDKRDKKRAKQAGMNRADWRKAEDAKSKVSEVPAVVKSELQRSLEAKWAAQNEMAVLKLKREKEMFEAQDVEALKKMQRSKVLKATEKNLVAVEAAHNSLKRSGNVPGFAETVVSGEGVPSLSGGSDSISPNSSISEADVWKMKKELEDVKAECERLKGVSRNFGLDKLRSGDTVAFTADNMSDAFEEKIRVACDGAFTLETYPGDEETLYYKRAS